ncbi:hypothetical protein LINGRAHAP2_LOCUS3046, partial [Linum grandiflorum]
NNGPFLLCLSFGILAHKISAKLRYGCVRNSNPHFPDTSVVHLIMNTGFRRPEFTLPTLPLPVSLAGYQFLLPTGRKHLCRTGIESRYFGAIKTAGTGGRRRIVLCRGLFPPVTMPSIDSQSIAYQLFALSLLPYIGFLYFITKSKTAPPLTLFGFYFLLVFVGATKKLQYGTSLSNVDWLHGGVESLLTLTNLFIVLGLRQGLRKVMNDVEAEAEPSPSSSIKEEEGAFH